MKKKIGYEIRVILEKMIFITVISTSFEKKYYQKIQLYYGKFLGVVYRVKANENCIMPP